MDRAPRALSFPVPDCSRKASLALDHTRVIPLANLFFRCFVCLFFALPHNPVGSLFTGVHGLDRKREVTADIDEPCDF